MSISDNLNDREHDKFKESVATPGQPAVAIVNPDGTNIGGAGGTSMTDDTAFVQGANSLTPAGFLGDDAPNALGAGERIGVARMNRLTRALFAELVDDAGTPITGVNGLPVNVVAGGAGGGVAQTQVRNAGDTAWDNVGPSAARSKMPVNLYDGSGNIAKVINADPAGTDYGLVVRNIPSGTQAVSGPLTDAQLRASAVPVDTELPAAAALADAAANPTTPTVGAGVLVWNGTGWDRVRGDVANGVDVDVTRLPALPAGTNNIGDVDVATQPARARTTDSISAADATDRLMDNLTALTPKFARINGATSGDNTLVAAVATKKIRVVALSAVAAGAVTVNFQTAAAGAMLAGPYTLAANGGIVLPYNPVGWFETVASDLLNMELSAAVTVGGCLTYVEV